MIAAAGLLIWVGSILTPDDVSTIDGLEGLLFRYVPVGPFTWIGGAVFASLGVRMVFKAIRADTTLRLTTTGVTLPRGTEAAWDQVVDARANRKDDLCPDHELLSKDHESPPKHDHPWQPSMCSSRSHRLSQEMRERRQQRIIHLNASFLLILVRSMR